MSAPTPFGRYLLHGVLGSGGMAVAYRATLEGPQGFTRQAVVKRMLPGFFADPRNVRMMAAEARVLSKLSHPSVVQLYEFGEVAGEHFIAMEYIEGVDLSALLAKVRAQGTRLDVELVCLVGARLASALAAAHALADEGGRSLGVVHRDVTPSNVMVSTKGEVKLLDFGIASMVAEAGAEVDKTKTNVVKGKLTYVAPEQLEGRRADARSDVYSLGVLLYEAFSGQRLFAGGNDLEVLARRQALRHVPALSSVVGGVPAEAERLVSLMLEPSPAQRSVSAREVERGLGAFVPEGAERRLAALVTSARSATPVPVVPTDEVVADPILITASGVTSEPVVAKRSSWRWLLATLALVGVVASIAAVKAVSGSALEAERGLQAVGEPNGAWPGDEPSPPPTAEPPNVDTREPRPVGPSKIRLRVTGTTGARVELDGELLGVVPLAIELERSGSQATIVLSRVGFSSATRTISLDHDTDLEVPLKRAGSVVKPKKPPVEGKKDFADPFR